VLGWIAGLGVLASYCIQFLSVFEFLGSGYFLLGYQRTAVFGFGCICLVFLRSGYFILKYQRSMVFGSHIGALVK